MRFDNVSLANKHHNRMGELTSDLGSDLDAVLRRVDVDPKWCVERWAAEAEKVVWCCCKERKTALGWKWPADIPGGETLADVGAWGTS